MDTQVELAARVLRNNTAEAVHYASVAVVDGQGHLTHYLGDPYMTIMARSSIKPFQLLPLITTGAAAAFDFTPKQLAIMCGSHTGSDEHRDVVLSNLKLAGNKPEDLQCGSHWPIGMEMARQYPTSGEDSDPVRHNCSGKHSGFLALARHLGEDIAKYLDPDSQTQQIVKTAVAEYCEFAAEKMDVTIDGCSAPNFSMPLYNLALGFKKLANVEGSSVQQKDAAATIKAAMIAYPEMVSGEKRLDLSIMRSFPRNVVCKIGAESLEGVGFADPCLGIAVKVHDGNQRALGAIFVEVMKQLGIIANMSDFPYLKSEEKPPVRNSRNVITGYIVPDFKLRKA